MKHNLLIIFCITAAALSSIIFWETDYLWIVLAAIALLFVSVTAYGSAQIQANYFLKSINRGKIRAISLTFDDGPDPDSTPRILDTLLENNLKATFFVIGRKAVSHPELLRRIVEEGHTIANHSYSHHYLIALFSTQKLQTDIQRCNDAIRDITGHVPLFFRPPFGVTNPRYAAVLKDLQMQSIGWSLRSMDTRAKNKYQLIRKIISKLKAKDIVLLHDHLPLTADTLPDIIGHCREMGIKIEPLPRLIGKEPYEKH
ncbi:polysaccharide deacetylase family protein [Dyadobacter fermentans]|uniref:Polysaccharide deacetylase n=1 Tax=Dyadobacter fermentans (strain ATCC 700827 / DSM 18053 / CIP 107007 / KCTC 52180 / NS114) TaxID=471854 RepID=C6VW78_DYAFD|nr:polysaccharide deacetylase family protein [Dyadobacter fermentans]ACT93210.1 polysaccharide deacetylase [Dyadobacter fermentans DSM 18053]